MSDIRQGSVEGDLVTDEYVEAVLSVGLIHAVRVAQRVRPALLTDTCGHMTTVTTQSYRVKTRTETIHKNEFAV